MADLTITAANVAKGSNASIVQGTAGAAITAGQTVYLDAATSTYKLFDANGSGTTTLAGIALHAAASGQPVQVQTGGDITIGATVTQGLVYVGSATPGGVAPSADLASGWTSNVIGVAVSTTVIRMQILASGVAV